MKCLPAFLCLFIFCGGAGAAGSPGKAETAARELSLRVAENPGGVERLFDKKFFRGVSLAQLEEILVSLRREAGRVTGVRLERAEGELAGRFVYSTDAGYEIPVSLTLDPETGLIGGLFFKVPYKKDATLAGVEAGLAGLPGRAGLLAVRLGKEPQRLSGLNEKEYFAVGSVFKLYVLGAMLEERVPWSRVFRLGSADKSLPSGRLQDWPDGSPLTAHTLAAMMISESDNTASDLLISAVGRRNIESRLAALGHSDPARLTPFLKTSELFRLRSDTGAAVKYLSLPAGEKYAFLAGLETPLAAEKVKRSPFGVDKLEWPASPSDVCALMQYFAAGGSDAALDILGLNKGLDIPPAFSYAGYKGGSEPGVLSAAWLLRKGESDWYCLAGSWNSDKEDLDEGKFFGFMQSALRALGAVK